MLARANRLTTGSTFATTIRGGRRAGRSTLVVHVAGPGRPEGEPPQVGLVVSRAVGNAVVRNQVKRRLRHLTRDRLHVLPEGTVLVVRALPAAAAATSAVLGDDLDRALDRVLSGAST
jgi:ribonuclease P protein component